jgi:hypothetical protein
VLLAGAAALAAGAWATTGSRTPAPESPPVTQGSAEAAAPNAAAGMRLFIDPETGEFGMPSPEASQILEKAMADVLPPSGEPVLMRHPDGHLLVDLNGRGMNYYVARRGADGSVHVDCVHTEATAERVIQVPPPVDANGREVQ